MKYPGGRVRTHRSNGPAAYDFPWNRTAKFDAAFETAAKKTQLEPAWLAAISVIESDSTHYGNDGAPISRYDTDRKYPSIGVMQVKLGYHSWRDPKVDGKTPEGNIALAALVLREGIDQYGSIDASLSYKYHPGIDPNGTTPGSYIAVFHSLLGEIEHATAPMPEPGPVKPPAERQHPYDIMFGGYPWRVEYGFLADVGLNYYTYGVNHGTSRSTMHTGDDVLVPDETALYALAPGRVTCVGWQGEVTWGQGCGYFEDVDGGGIGNISILYDSGHKVVYGHSSRSYVDYGDRVVAGQKIGTSGSMNGPHTHVEVAVERNGSYWLVDPIPALRNLVGGEPVFISAERVPIPQPNEFDQFWTVQVLQDGVPVLQRANPNARPVSEPFTAGEEFEACYIAIGHDAQPYWIGRYGGRVPLAGTQGPDWLGSIVAPDCPPDQMKPFLEELVDLVAKYERSPEHPPAAVATDSPVFP
jgi:Peptidase family M23